MSHPIQGRKGDRRLLMGNEAIARGALEAGVNVATGYPGTPSSEIIENLAAFSREGHLYVEWSCNEKVALEVAAAASFAGLRALCVMKQNGVNVASDFLLHLAGTGTRGGMVLVSCDDPGALSSANEGESRHFAKLVEIPLLEPGDFQEAKDLMKWAFDLSEKIGNLVMVRSVTRLSHASGNVNLGDLSESVPTARFDYQGTILDGMRGPVLPFPVPYKHGVQQEKLQKASALFEDAPFNVYKGPESPELLIITSSACYLYSMEAIHLLGVADRVGVLKLGTTWPLPPKLMEKYLGMTDNVLVVEEVLPFLEENVKVLAAELGAKIGFKRFFGKRDGSLPTTGELNPDQVTTALSHILKLHYEPVPAEYEKKGKKIAAARAPQRDMNFCPGCPHRASFWTIHHVLALDNRQGFVCGDIGCYSIGFLPSGYGTLKTLHAMGSGTGIASGFGKLGAFGLDQPVIAVCGDSTFFHAAVPALINGVHSRSNMIMIILDNSGTGMTGFQPHPGLPVDATGNRVPAIDIPAVCRAIGADVTVCDPFDLDLTRQTLLDLLEDARGVRVLVLKQICALSPEKKGKKTFEMSINEAACLGESCGCNRLCTRILKCPGLIWNKEKGKAEIDQVICTGCGVCASICPAEAIKKREAF